MVPSFQQRHIFRCQMTSTNPFEGSGNPFEADDEAKNPFEQESFEEDDIVIPSLDDELDRVVSNPFEPNRTDEPEAELNGILDEETTAMIENVNLTYRNQD